MSFANKTTKTNSSFANQTDPWDETVPYLKDFLASLGGTAAAGQPGATDGQTAAFDQLKATAAAGNPNADKIMALANDEFAAPDNSGMVKSGYADLQSRLTDTANGKNLDLGNSGYLQKLLTQVGDDAQNRVNASFAAAGRDFSGANQGAVARGVTQAQAPLLLDQYNKEQSRTDAAARDLFGAAGSTAGQVTSLQAAQDAMRTKGIATTQSALDARDQGANTMLKLEQQLKDLPYDDLNKIAALLFPAAGLGQQSSGTGTQTAKSSGFSVGIGDIGKAVTALGTICDARMKTNIVEVGALADGTPIYSFCYLGSDQVHIGPMAHEVAARTPEAVRTVGAEQMLVVDLGRATERSAALIQQRKGA